MTHPFDPLHVASDTGAALIFTPCPGTKGTSIRDALMTLQHAGAHAVISLTPSAELAALNVSELGAECAELDLAWFHCPVADDHAPSDDFTNAWLKAAPTIHQLLDAGKSVAIHCKGGSGRTGLIAAQILFERGHAKASIIGSVQSLRPFALTLAPHVQYFNALTSNKDQ